ncbi:MAG: sigma-70 family RNA polymerase sigma factor [Actinomycetia bacterium]|nr:sigma-70 family RNA polymerase sigma factor [Actinomycetes bacterium]
MEAATIREDFARTTDGYRRELLVHCYRMLGSIQDAEDLVQETYLRAWRSYGNYDRSRSSLRTWLYRIATNACLTALEQRSRRAMPSGLGAPGTDPEGSMDADTPEVSWLQPLPDAMIFAGDGDPAAVAESREQVRLALIAALQHLPPRQRAILILRDVLAWRAAEAADLAGISTAAANSALQRARTRRERVMPPADNGGDLGDAEQRELLDHYATAFETADIAALTSLLAEDAVWEMPPIPAWFAGRDNVSRLVASKWPPEGGRMIPTGANGQPAFGFYVPDGVGGYRAHSLQVLTVAGRGVTRVAAFHDHDLFIVFGLPPTLPTGMQARSGATPSRARSTDDHRSS